jgi:F-type H+-transporting ATPase subunit delta
MAEIATIARPYAEALFKSAKAGGADLGATAAWLQEAAAAAATPELRAFADNPKADAAQVFGIVSGVVKSPLNDQAKNFLRTVIENGRLNALPEVAAQFQVLKNAATGSADAVVHSAFAIEGAALADLSALLEKRFGRRLNVRVVQDAALIGGVRVVVGDEVLDTSVKARLEQMKQALVA